MTALIPNPNWLPVKTRVRVRATGAPGTVVAVLLGTDGAPWSVQVKLETDPNDGWSPPLILAPCEVERTDWFN